MKRNQRTGALKRDPYNYVGLLPETLPLQELLLNLPKPWESIRSARILLGKSQIETSSEEPSPCCSSRRRVSMAQGRSIWPQAPTETGKKQKKKMRTAGGFFFKKRLSTNAPGKSAREGKGSQSERKKKKSRFFAGILLAVSALEVSANGGVLLQGLPFQGCLS